VLDTVLKIADFQMHLTVERNELEDLAQLFTLVSTVSLRLLFAFFTRHILKRTETQVLTLTLTLTVTLTGTYWSGQRLK